MKDKDLRFYRDYGSDKESNGVAFKASIETTDLYIRAEKNLEEEALLAIGKAREILNGYIGDNPEFATSLTPLPLSEEGPQLVKAMLRAGVGAGTGPMAAVAGSVAGYVGRALRKHSRWVIVENGGDIYIDTGKETLVGLWAGTSPFSGKVGIRVDASNTPVGVCTSSGTVGPSLSYGKADAACALSHDIELADAVATAMGNRIKAPADLESAVEWALSINGIFGALAVIGEKMACRGELEIEKIV